jgi:hypothetical protein
MCHEPHAITAAEPMRAVTLRELNDAWREDLISRGGHPIPARIAAPTMALAFNQVPALGTEVMWRGQPYELVEVTPYTRSDGAPSQVLVWEAPCWTCGEPFQVRASLGGARGLNRRCARHKRPGVRVKLKRAA